MLTVILPNFNHGHFLPFSLKGVLEQTRPADEMIVIDDVSSDDSVAVIESFLPKFPNARLVRNPRNLGVVGNMNLGLSLAAGDTIAFMAADDVAYPRYFERALALLEAYPHAGFVSGRSEIIDAGGAVVGALNVPSPLNAPGYIAPEQASCILMRDDSWFMGNVTMFRRALLQANGGFPAELSAFTDGYVTRLLAVKYGACYAPEVWGAWRRLEGTLSWSETAAFETVAKTAELAAQRMRDSGAFAPGYPERWRRRYIFGARRFALSTQRRRAKAAGALPYVAACVRELLGSSWWFATLRPQDAAATARRWLARAPDRK